MQTIPGKLVLKDTYIEITLAY